MAAEVTASASVKRQPVWRAEGLGWRWQLLVFLAAALLVFSRCPSLFLRWQFYAEDGKTWFQQAYNLGWLHSLTIPDAGYLNSLQRLLTGPALLVPFRFAPLVQAFEGLLLQVLPVTVLLSARCRSWASLPARALMAALYVGLPCSTEVHVVLTDSQWHFALAELLMAFGDPPATRVAWAGDLLLFTLGGFCGPFCLLLLPLTLVLWFLRRERWRVAISAAMAVGSAVQVWELMHGIAVRGGELGASVEWLARILGGDLLADALMGQHNFAQTWPLPAIALAAAALVSLFVYCLLRAPTPMRLMIVFSALILAGALHAPMIQGDAPQWQLLARVTTSRYWFFPIVTLLWCLAWCALDGVTAAGRELKWSAWSVSAASFGLLALSLTGVVHDWRVPAMTDAHFAASAARFAAAEAGAHVTIPEYPEGWQMNLVKH